MATSLQHTPAHILPVIVIAQVAGTSLWFAGNAVMESLQQTLGLPASAVSHITSAVQFGFILGTLGFALLTIADRFAPSKVFFTCALLAALATLGVLLAEDFVSLLMLRMLTGFFLAGIYPVGMKIAADWHQQGLGKALGYLVGALVLGTASPHLLKALMHSLPVEGIFIATAAFAFFGGLLLLLLVPEGPFRRRSQGFDPGALVRVFRNRPFRAAAMGYFGHMWELYTFWAFVPLALITYAALHGNHTMPVSLFSFAVIAVGSLGCVAGGYVSLRRGSDWVARRALLFSGACCIASPFAFWLPYWAFIAFLLFWGVAVVADSPQFSALVARHAPIDMTGTALTIVNCVGFGITIISLQLINLLDGLILPQYRLTFLAIGPFIGLYSLIRQGGRHKPAQTF